MENTLKIRVSCPSCEEPVKFIYHNYDGLTINQISNILDAVKYKDDYHISVLECEHPNRKCNKNATHVHALSNLILWVSRVRLSRTVLKETVHKEKKLIDSLVATRFLEPFICDNVEWQGMPYTFINERNVTGTEVRRKIANLLYLAGYSTGTSVNGNPFVRNAEIHIERENHPLYRYGVWRIYEVREVHGYVYETKTDE